MGIIGFIESVCVQTAVYWGNPQPSGMGGMIYDSPVEIKVRWDGKKQVVRTKKGKEVISNAEILVTQELDEEGYIYLGSLAEFATTPENPMGVDGAFEILSTESTPLFRSTDEFVRTVYV